MFDFSFGELALIVLVALLVVGPKDLPRVMHAVGRWFGQFKGITQDFREGFKATMREHQLHEVEQDLETIHREIEYIKDRNGNMQRVYDIADFLEERERAKPISLTQDGDKKSPGV